MIDCKLTIGDYLFTVASTSGDSNTKDIFISDVFETKSSDGTTSQSYKFVFSCDDLKYYKKVYEPCKIVATMKVTQGNGVETLPTIKALEDLFLTKAVTMEMAGGTKVAESYHVHEIIPKYESSSVKIKLHIFSNDKKLTLDKYCKAYTGRKLVEDILKTNIQLVDAKWKKKDDKTDSTVPTLLNSAKVTIADDSKLQFLSYKNGDIEHELIQPYLVQYNESFYDFLARTANRCGEFVFFENGKLYVGLPTNAKAEITITSYTSLEYHRTQALSIKDVQNRYYNGVNEDSSIVAEGDDEVYDFQISQDEYFTKYIKDSWDSFGEEFDFISNPKKEAVNFLGSALNNSTMAKVVESYLFNLAKTAIFAESKVKTENDKKNKKFYDNFNDDQKSSYTEYEDIEKKKEEEEKDKTEKNNKRISEAKTPEEKKKIEKEIKKENEENKVSEALNGFTVNLDEKSDTKKYYASPFSSAYTYKNLTSVFYSEISKKEQEAEQGAITLVMNSGGEKIQLASKIKVKNQHFIVTDIVGEIDANEKYTITAVPILTLSKDKEAICPPPFGGESIRKSAPQIAIVADKSDPEGKGRVRIRYTWQKENSDMSPWIRMAVPFSSEGGGIFFEPTVGTELLIDYTGGNIERPYVVGQLYARKGKTPGNRVIASTNGQKIVMSDEDPNDMFCGINDFLEIIPNCEGLPDQKALEGFTGGIKMTDAYGLYTISMSSVNRNITIKSPFGDVKMSAFTGISISAPNGDISITGKNVKITANNRLELTSGKNIYDGSWGKNGLNKLVKYGKEELGAAAADLIYDNTIGTVVSQINMGLIRTIFEAFAPPKAGNFTIKSNRYLSLSAGKGEVEMPDSAFTSRKIGNDAKEKNELIKVVSAVRNVPFQINNWIEACKTKYDNARNKIQPFKDELNDKAVDDKGASLKPATIDDFVKKVLNEGRKGKVNITETLLDFHMKQTNPSGNVQSNAQSGNAQSGNAQANAAPEPDKSPVLNSASELASAMNEFVNTVKKPKIETTGCYDTGVDLSSYFKDDDDLLPKFYKEALENDHEITTAPPDIDSNEKNQIKRKLIVKFIKESSVIQIKDDKGEINMSQIYDNSNEWNNMADHIVEKKESSLMDSVKDYLLDKANDFVPIDWFKSRDTWGTMKKGEILFSDKSGKTLNFENGHLNYVDNSNAHIDRIKQELKENF